MVVFLSMTISRYKDFSSFDSSAILKFTSMDAVQVTYGIATWQKIYRAKIAKSCTHGLRPFPQSVIE